MVEIKNLFNNLHLENIINKGDKIKDKIMNKNFISLSKNNFGYLIISVLMVIILLSVSIYMYNIYIKPNINKSYVANKEFVTENKHELHIIWFYTEWCPYCKSKLYVWNNFKKKLDVLKFPVKVIAKEINCDKNEKIANNYNINEYPSIRIDYRNKVYIYDAEITEDTLLQFLFGTIPNYNPNEYIDDDDNNINNSNDINNNDYDDDY